MVKTVDEILWTYLENVAGTNVEIGPICIRVVYWYFLFNMGIVGVSSEFNSIFFAALFPSCSQLSWKRARGLQNNQNRNSDNVSPSQIHPCKYSSLKIHPVQGFCYIAGSFYITGDFHGLQREHPLIVW